MKVGMSELLGMPTRLLLFKSSKGNKLACKVSEFSYQLSLALAIKLVKMEKQSERVSGFVLAKSFHQSEQTCF